MVHQTAGAAIHRVSHRHRRSSIVPSHRHPGAFELPLGAQRLIKNKKVDAVVTLGCLYKGETLHFEYATEAPAHGLMRVGLDTGKPVVFGVLPCLNEKQAQARSSGDNNHGYGWGMTAVEMALSGKTKKTA